MSRQKVKCPCCGESTIAGNKTELYEICEVCYWENDPIQNENPDYTGGANNHSLNQYRKEFKKMRELNPSFNCKNEKDRDYMIEWDQK